MFLEVKIPTANVPPHTTHALVTVESVLMETVMDLEVATPEDYLTPVLLVVSVKLVEVVQVEAVWVSVIKAQVQTHTENVLPHTIIALETIKSVLMETVMDLEAATPEDCPMLVPPVLVFAKLVEAVQAEAV